MVHEPVEQRRDDHDIAEETCPVVDGPIGRDDGRGFLVACHEHIGEFVAGVRWQFAQEEIVDEQEFDARDVRAQFAELRRVRALR